jgi:hypothetical protein
MSTQFSYRGYDVVIDLDANLPAMSINAQPVAFVEAASGHFSADYLPHATYRTADDLAKALIDLVPRFLAPRDPS